MSDRPEQKGIDGWTVKVLQPEAEARPRLFLLLHGWTGDENSMWVFASQLPRKWLMIAPRAPYMSRHPELGGYSWVSGTSSDYPTYAEFDSAIERLAELLELIKATYPQADFERIDVAGFSQGAALAARFALENPGRIHRLAILAGFLPEGAPAKAGGSRLEGLNVFIAHGRRDETVPVESARAAAERFEDAGAMVNYCESESGHKLSAECFRGFKAHFDG
jgi:phospholipase/carboxylesterase